ncbi:hypothetical protein L1994_11100 [Methanomicrobium antiquum]|uniref:Uncharacterized protein n=1 Tax=Methanomicrobium antiquum TaxID=487686 RepID=A0AAF0JTR6_9EURY|nr:KEOPS complex subunit Cgi121 [Methanomicrobium antiquum]WFN36673.1 hypothetical protein L1994_11100 [Methanomicrobium antiquum]
MKPVELKNEPDCEIDCEINQNETKSITDIFGVENYKTQDPKLKEFFFVPVSNVNMSNIDMLGGSKSKLKVKLTSNCGLFCGVAIARAEIKGIKTCLKALNEIANEYNAYIICLNEDNIAGKEHINSAICHATRSWFSKNAISNSFEMEVLLYAGGIRQCSLAGAFGLQKGENNLYICVCIFSCFDNDKVRMKTAERGSNIPGTTSDIILQILERLENDKIFLENENKFNFNFLDEIYSDNFSGILDLEEREKSEEKSEEKMRKLEKIKRLMKMFDITKEEIESVGSERFIDLVIERVALLDINK